MGRYTETRSFVLVTEKGSFVAVALVDSLPGIFHFVADLPGPLFLGANAGEVYWFTVANTTSGWSWAEALNGATVGADTFNAHRSTNEDFLCGDGGPHCGPWTDVHSDLAFRLSAAVPEPGSLALLAIGALGLGVIRKRQMQ